VTERKSPVIAIDLALELHAAGLPWEPDEGDRFVLPDRGMDAQVFTISEMVVEVRRSAAGRVIAFNGTTEWALDSIEQAEAVWIPRESQLRVALGDRLLSLARTDGGWRCTVRVSTALHETDAGEADEAYARALLHVLHTRS
jgi:hypothetical protein